MKRLFTLPVVACAALGLASTLGTAAASAAPIGQQAVVKSDDSAGYSTVTAAPITTFSGSLSVPTVTCPATDVSMYPNIAITDSAGDSVTMSYLVNCEHGSPFYAYSSVDVHTAAGVDHTAQTMIAAGDSLSFGLTVTATTTTTTVTDTTSGQSAATSAKIKPNFTYAQTESFFGNGGTGNVTPIPQFTPVKFGVITLNGATLNTYPTTKYQMYDGKTLQVAASAITGGSFSTTYKHA